MKWIKLFHVETDVRLEKMKNKNKRKRNIPISNFVLGGDVYKVDISDLGGCHCGRNHIGLRTSDVFETRLF